MNCRTCRRVLSALLDGRTGQNDALIGHLASCSACADYGSALERAREALRLLPAAAPPADLSARATAFALSSEPRQSSWLRPAGVAGRRRFRRESFGTSALVALLMLVGAAVGVYLDCVWIGATTKEACSHRRHPAPPPLPPPPPPGRTLEELRQRLHLSPEQARAFDQFVAEREEFFRRRPSGPPGPHPHGPPPGSLP